MTRTARKTKLPMSETSDKHLTTMARSFGVPHTAEDELILGRSKPPNYEIALSEQERKRLLQKLHDAGYTHYQP